MSLDAYTRDTLVQQTTEEYPQKQPDRESVCACNGSPRSCEKVGEKVGENPGCLKLDGELTIRKLPSMIGVTERSIERNTKKLQEQGRLRRVGPAKGGRLEVQ